MREFSDASNVFEYLTNWLIKVDLSHDTVLTILQA